MFKNLPRQTFRDVQEVLFPAFFQVRHRGAPDA